MPLITLFWHHREFAFLLSCILSELMYNIYISLLFLPFLFAKASILATVLSGLPSWVWIALAHNRLPLVAQLLSISLSILGQSSCVQNIQVKQQTLSLSLSLSLSLLTIGCHGLTSCYLSLLNPQSHRK